MGGLSIQETVETTGWSPRMLRYLEKSGLVTSQRSPGGHRRYSPRQVQRLREMKELIEEFDLGITDLAYERRVRTEPDLAHHIDAWFGGVHRVREPESSGIYRRLAAVSPAARPR
jgi:adenosylhomocysteinase